LNLLGIVSRVKRRLVCVAAMSQEQQRRNVRIQ